MWNAGSSQRFFDVVRYGPMSTVGSLETSGVLSQRIRALLVGLGAVVVVLAIAAVSWRIARGGVVGPTQLELLLAGVVLLALGVAPAPSRALAHAVTDARRRAPVVVRPTTSRQRVALAAIVAAACAFRLVMIGAYWPTHQIVSGMPLWDAEMARNLLQGRGWMLNWEFVERMNRAVVEQGRTVDLQDFYPVDDARPGAIQKLPFYAHTPGYAVWLAASFVLGGSHRFIYSQWMQAALDAMACLLVFGIGRRLWSAGAGIAGAVIYALSPGSVYLAIQPVAAATDSFWVLLVGYGIVRLATGAPWTRDMWIGLAAVVAAAVCGAMMNTLAYTLPLAAAGGAVLIALIDRRAWRVALSLALAHALVFVLLVPWGLRNLRVYGEFAETRQTFWQHTWETLGAIPNPWGLVLESPTGGGKDDAFYEWIRVNCPAPCWPSDREAFTRGYLLKNVFTSPRFPMHVVRLVIKQFPGIVYVSRLPADQPYAGSGPAGRAFAAFLSAINFAMLLLWPAALVGLVLLTIRKTTAVAAWAALTPSVFLIVFSLVLFIEHRKTTQALGYITALAGVAVWAAIDARRQQQPMGVDA
jgi:hypothetical protein